ncbi:MAG: hypothetical protein GF384_07450 [Elusimicrobia bacterium]|nr:hypothetical protein [Elusimicrobiota bacterium]MBD3412492.1 hypothetical protein [Elusimicrobiota bacterium]
MYYLYIITGLVLVLSMMTNRKKTFLGIKIAAQRLIFILPAFLIMLIVISFIVFLIPDEMIVHYLGADNLFQAVIYAVIIGSITLMPGFITFPLCGILLDKGVSYIVLSAFTTTLMMVGVLTYPIEKEYFGVKVTIVRNIISLCIALIVAFMTGIFFNEIF